MINLTRMQTLIGVERRLHFRREKILASATRVTTVLTGMPRGSGGHDQVADGAIQVDEVKRAYRETLGELEQMLIHNFRIHFCIPGFFKITIGYLHQLIII